MPERAPSGQFGTFWRRTGSSWLSRRSLPSVTIKGSSYMSILAFILFLIVAAACAWIAEAIVPGAVPGGFLVSAIVGILGAWLGASLFGHFGPDLAGVPLLPAI